MRYKLTREENGQEKSSYLSSWDFNVRRDKYLDCRSGFSPTSAMMPKEEGLKTDLYCSQPRSVINMLFRRKWLSAFSDGKGTMSSHDELQNLLQNIDVEYKYTCGYTGRPVPNHWVIEAIVKVPRHNFVSAAIRSRNYTNAPLPIGLSQTISQPYIIALMVDLLDLNSNSTVLEIGTGYGYQAAVLAKLVKKVVSIEIIEDLAIEAKIRLSKLGYDNVITILGDGYNGWPEFAPFDGIIVNAASLDIPPPLVRQLSTGGRLVIPVGPPYGNQHLFVIIKVKEESILINKVLDVAFVPLTGTLGKEK